VIRRAARLEAIVAAKRELHPELARPLTWTRLRAVCRREGVHLCCVPLPKEQPAELVPFLGRWSILVSDECAPRERVKLAAHELGHLWAHHDPHHERWELVYQIDSPAPGGALEREADGIAMLLLEGLATFPPRPRRATATAIAAIERLVDPYSDRAPTITCIGRRQPKYGGAKLTESRLSQALRMARRVPSTRYPISPYRSKVGS
jgi:hypothetical protein